MSDIVRKLHANDGHQGGMEFVLSDATPDRYDDVIDPNGWELTNFKKNPIALFNHNSSFPIGRWETLTVKNGALRGHLHMAPAETSPRIAELHALINCGVLKSVSVGFMPIESKARSDSNKGGVLYGKAELVETSLVSIPANPNALAVAKSLKISDATMREVFKQRTGDLTIAQRIRRARRAVRKAKLLQERADTPAKRNTISRSIAIFEKEERELQAKLRAVPKQTTAERQAERARELRASAEALLQKINRQIAQEEAATPLGQKRQEEADTLAAFTTHAGRHLDPPKHEDNQGWRGQKPPGLTWRGRKI